MKQITFLFVFLNTTFLNAQTLHSRAYGIAKNPAIIFIHGGPSGNSTLFEATTAQALADQGFYVIVYDRRGEGRSVDTTATFTYNEAIADLNKIYQTYKIEKAHIVGHSFGGLVATLYAERHTEKIQSLILAGALFSQQETYDHILKSVKYICRIKKDTLMFKEVLGVEKLNKNTAEYRKLCFELASKNDYFKMPVSTNEAGKLRQQYESGDFYKDNIRNQDASVSFYKNEPLKNIKVNPILKKLKKNGVKLYGIYGRQDKIFSNLQMTDLKAIVGVDNFVYLDNCSHYLFVDQQKEFIVKVKKWIK